MTSKFHYIKVSPIATDLETVLNEKSEYNEGVRAEMACALNAPELLAALKSAVSDLKDSDQFFVRHAWYRSIIAKCEQ